MQIFPGNIQLMAVLMKFKGENLHIQAEKLYEDKELGRIWQDGY